MCGTQQAQKLSDVVRWVTQDQRNGSDTFPTADLPLDSMKHGRSVSELTNLGGKQHSMDIVFQLFPPNFTMDFPLSSTENKGNHLQQLRGRRDPICPSTKSVLTRSILYCFSRFMSISALNFSLFLQILRLNFPLHTLASKQS